MASVTSSEVQCSTYILARAVVDYSGSSATAHIQYYHTAGGYTGYTGSFTYGAGGSSASGSWSNARVNPYWETFMSISFSISQGGGDYTIWCSGYSYNDFSVSVHIPSQYTAPTGLSVSIAEKYPTGAKFNVSVSSYGNPSSASGRYIEAAILNQNTYGATYRFSTASNTSSSAITVNNNSTGGTLTVQPNKEYYYGAYASNTQRNTSKVQGTFVTLAEAPTLSVNTLGETDVVMNYSTTADGNKYTKSVQYSLDNGSTWTTGATVSTGSASSGTFTISGLTDDTSYTLKCRVSTTAGNTNGTDVTFTTLESHKLYGSVAGKTKKIVKLYGSVAGKTKEITKLYASVGGQTKRIF